MSRFLVYTRPGGPIAVTTTLDAAEAVLRLHGGGYVLTEHAAGLFGLVRDRP